VPFFFVPYSNRRSLAKYSVASETVPFKLRDPAKSGERAMAQPLANPKWPYRPLQGGIAAATDH
jgi:hypothetical protein